MGWDFELKLKVTPMQPMLMDLLMQLKLKVTLMQPMLKGLG